MYILESISRINIPANMLDSSIGFELLIVRKGYSWSYNLDQKCIYQDKDLFSSLRDSQRGNKYVTSISMFFGNKILPSWRQTKESTKLV
jgi:hypothetical protein